MILAVLAAAVLFDNRQDILRHCLVVTMVWLPMLLFMKRSFLIRRWREVLCHLNREGNELLRLTYTPLILDLLDVPVEEKGAPLQEISETLEAFECARSLSWTIDRPGKGLESRTTR